MSGASKPHSELLSAGQAQAGLEAAAVEMRLQGLPRSADLIMDCTRSLVEQFESAQSALRRIAQRDTVDEWITGEECAEIARAELARASTRPEVEGSHPSGCRCQACLFGETGNEEALAAVRRAASIPASERGS